MVFFKSAVRKCLTGLMGLSGGTWEGAKISNDFLKITGSRRHD